MIIKFVYLSEEYIINMSKIILLDLYDVITVTTVLLLTLQ